MTTTTIIKKIAGGKKNRPQKRRNKKRARGLKQGVAKFRQMHSSRISSANGGKGYAGVVKRIINSITLPSENSPLRLISNPPELTSLFSFQQNAPSTVAATTNNSFLVFKDNSFPLWRNFVGTVTHSAYFSRAYTNSDSYQYPVVPQSPGATVALTTSLGEVSTGIAGSTPVGAFSGPIIGSGADANVWVYVPKGFAYQVMVTTSTSMAGATFCATVTRTYDGNTDRNTTAVIDGIYSNPTTLFFYWNATELTTGCWVMLDSIGCVTAPTTVSTCYITSFSAGVTTGGSLFTPTAKAVDYYYPMEAVGRPEIGASTEIYKGCRLNAASFLFKNTTKVLDKEGYITCAVLKVDGRKPFSDHTTVKAYCNDATVRLRYNGLLEDGLYTYMLPEMDNCALTKSAHHYFPYFHLGSSDYFYFVEMDATTTDQNLQIIYTCHHECRNDSQLFPTGLSTITLEDDHQAKLELLTHTPFYENPTHMAAILAAGAKMAREAYLHLRPKFNPWAHRAVDWLVPRYPRGEQKKQHLLK